MVGHSRCWPCVRCCYEVQSTSVSRSSRLCRQPRLVRIHNFLFIPWPYSMFLLSNFHAATAVSLVKHFRDCVKAAPRELYANVLFTAGPTGKGSLVVVQICYIGPREKGREFLEAIGSWDGEPCILNEVSEKTFLHQQDSVAQILRGKCELMLSPMARQVLTTS